MFKKTLVALAISAVAVSGAANAAATLTATDVAIALEGNQATAGGNSVLTQADITDIALDTGTAYIVNDLVVFTVSGAEFDVTVPAVAAFAGSADLNFVDFSDANNARFRVSTADSSTGDDITLTTFTLKTGSAVDKTKVKISSTAISVNALIGSYDAAKAVTVSNFKKQLVNTVTKLDGEVSTGKGRAEWTSSPNEDTLVIATANNAGTDALTITKAVHTIEGNFSWLMDYDTDKDGVLEPTELATAIAFTAATNDTIGFKIDTGLTKLTATQTLVSVLDASITFGFKNKGNTAGGSVIASPQSFTYSTVYTDATPTAITLAGSAGAFTLDGSTTDIGFLPFSSDYAQSITVTNTGSVVGAISVVLTADGMDYSKTLTAVADAKSVTNISLEVAAFAAESGISGNAAVNVTTNSPGIVVKGLYYHKPSADRVLVGETTDN